MQQHALTLFPGESPPDEYEFVMKKGHVVFGDGEQQMFPRGRTLYVVAKIHVVEAKQTDKTVGEDLVTVHTTTCEVDRAVIADEVLVEPLLYPRKFDVAQ